MLIIRANRLKSIPLSTHLFSKLVRQPSLSPVVLFQCLKVGDTRSLLTLGRVGNRAIQQNMKLIS